MSSQSVPAVDPNCGAQPAVLVVSFNADAIAETVARAKRLAPFSDVQEAAPLSPDLSRVAGFKALQALAINHSEGAAASGRRPVIILTGSWNPLLASFAAGAGANRLAPALAILASPEVLWLFDGVSQSDARVPWLRWHRLEALSSPLSNPLYDWTGLRQWLRSHLLGRPKSASDAWVIALDDEHRYRSLFAYTGYRAGYPSLAPESIAESISLLGPPPEGRLAGVDDLQLRSVEDISVQFPDQQAQHVLSEKKDRSQLLPVLDQAKRTFVTSGDARDEFSPRRKSWLFKPVKGLLALQSGAIGKTRGPLDPWIAPSNDRDAVDLKDDTVAGSGGRHATHGIMTEVATAMVARGEHLLDEPSDFDSLLLAAVLGLDTQMLLRGKSPTTALEALAVQQHAEVTIECIFAGVAADPRIRPRLVELESAAFAICSRYGAKAQRVARLNAKVEIANRLVGILRQHARFEEEMECLARVRSWRAAIHRTSGPFGWIYGWILAYFNSCVSYPLFLALLTLFWCAVFSLLYFFVPPTLAPWDAFQRAALTLVSLQPNGKSQSWLDVPCIFAGLVHFGLFISYLFSLVSRR